MDGVFRALNDPSRRELLDSLFERDGQTLGELVAILPQMTRYGVMSHLGVLEEAGLVTSRRDGRRKLHYLNPYPIREVHDRWTSKYAERVVANMAAVAQRAGGTTLNTPTHVYETYIKAPAEAVWKALQDGDDTVRYFYGTRVESTWEPGAALTYRDAEGTVVGDGEVIAIDPPKRLEIMFHARWDPELEAEGPVREVWLVEEAGPLTKLAVELWDLSVDSKTYADFVDGFPYIFAGLKTLLETGTAMAS